MFTTTPALLSLEKAHKLAASSGELGDLYKAVTLFEKSAKEEMPAEFWNDFGKACIALADHLQDMRPVIQSIACYKRSAAYKNSEGWIGLARGLKRLYQFSHEEEHYTQACEAFAQAPDAYLERIGFMIDASRRKKEILKLQTAIKLCEESHQTLHLQALHAEALSCLGEWTNQVGLLREAEAKMDAIFDKAQEEDPFLIHQHGKCLFAFASYYKDLDLYYQAIEEFQTALSIDRSQLTCWVWMGATFAQVYHYTDEVEALENAIYFYTKALQIKNEPHLQYEMAALLNQLGEVEEALFYLEPLVQSSTSLEHPEWLFEYGVALDAKGDTVDDPTLHQKALEMFVNVLMISPNYPEIHHWIALVYCHLGEALEESEHFYKALHHFKLASKSQIEDENLLMDWGLAWTQIAQRAIYPQIQKQSFTAAEQKFMEAAKLGSELVYYHLACLYSEQGSIDQSLAYLRKAYIAKTLPPLDELLEDDWLEEVRSSSRFQELLALLQKK